MNLAAQFSQVIVWWRVLWHHLYRSLRVGHFVASHLALQQTQENRFLASTFWHFNVGWSESKTSSCNIKVVPRQRGKQQLSWWQEFQPQTSGLNLLDIRDFIISQINISHADGCGYVHWICNCPHRRGPNTTQHRHNTAENFLWTNSWLEMERQYQRQNGN